MENKLNHIIKHFMDHLNDNEIHYMYIHFYHQRDLEITIRLDNQISACKMNMMDIHNLFDNTDKKLKYY